MRSDIRVSPKSRSLPLKAVLRTVGVCESRSKSPHRSANDWLGRNVSVMSNVNQDVISERHWRQYQPELVPG